MTIVNAKLIEKKFNNKQLVVVQSCSKLTLA